MIFIILLILLGIFNPDRVSCKVGYVFAHGYGGDREQVKYYKSSRVLMPQNPYNLYSYDGPEVKKVQEGGYEIDKTKVVFGQEDDVEALDKEEKKAEAECEETVGFGVSKGAATWLNMVALKKPAKLKALILESPYMNANEVFFNVGQRFGLGYVPFGRQVAKIGGKVLFKKYKPTGIQPIKMVKDIPENLPILILHSQKDGLISLVHSEILYSELVKTGHTNVYLVKIKSGYHANILNPSAYTHKQEFEENKKRYLGAVHAFYRKYGLPFDRDLAQGVNLDLYQPTTEEVKKQMKSTETVLEKVVPWAIGSAISYYLLKTLKQQKN